MTTMFLNDKNVVDHAYIDERGCVVGGSFGPCWRVTGDVDPEEKVVVDFSTCKKQIKSLIDHPVNGFDHKLWILPTSKCEWDFKDETEYGKNRIVIKSNEVEFDIPKERVKIIDRETDISYSCRNAGIWFEEYITEALQAIHGSHISVKCFNTEDMTTAPFDEGEGRELMTRFRYSHGLKNSTSWGCRNPAHGHYSYVSIRYENPHCPDALSAAIEVNNFLDCHSNLTFAWSENATVSSDGNEVEIDYYDVDGVRYFAKYKNDSLPIVLETETTVEFLTDYFAEILEPYLKRMKAKSLYVSEGLNKGAYKEFKWD